MQKLSSICKGRKNTAPPFSGDAWVSMLAQDFLLGINDVNPLSPQKETHHESCGFFIWCNDSSPFSLKGVEPNKKHSIAFFWRCAGFYDCKGFPFGHQRH